MSGWNKLNLHRRLTAIPMALTACLLAACGSADFSAGGGVAKSSSGGGAGGAGGAGSGAGAGGAGSSTDKSGAFGSGDATAATQLTSLTWFWQCDAAPVAAPKPKSAKDAVVVDGGQHAFAQGQLAGAALTFSGHVCPPAALPRDLLFVIDVSGSMAQNDPRTGDTCGRLQALQAVIGSMPAGAAAQYSLITFDSAVEKASTTFFPTEAGLVADIAGTGTIADVVCVAGTNTNYQAALTQADKILSTGRAGATKEIYFVSDGEPTAGLEGTAEADTLRNVGVPVGSSFITATIATVMLNGTGSSFEIAMSSKDAAGNPLHAEVSGSANLTQAITALAANGISTADLKYWPIGTTDVTTVDLKGKLQGFDFTLPSITIDPVKAPNGLQVLFEYLDQHDNRTSSGGELLWSAQSGAGGGSVK